MGREDTTVRHCLRLAPINAPLLARSMDCGRFVEQSGMGFVLHEYILKRWPAFVVAKRERESGTGESF